MEREQVRTADAVPSDPQYANQWNLRTTGWDAVHDSATLTGGATIAILDTGVASGHPDLAGKAAEFTVTAKALKVYAQPALDDELAKKLGLDSLEKLRDRQFSHRSP